MELVINNNLFKVKPIISKKDIANGMMGKSFNNNFNGMLFLMGNGNHTFWMKNCNINLDIIFIQNNIITKIHHNCPPCDSDDCERYTGYGDLVLEIDGGLCKEYDIRVDDIVDFIG
jgi:uncharacterized membrane protein (UPF0127 family)